MEVSFTFGNYSLSEMNFWLYTAAGLIIGIIVYGLGSHPSTRRAQFRNWPLLPKPVSAILGIGLCLLVFHWAQKTNWMVFYELEIQSDKLNLRYFYPEQTISLSCSEIESISIGRGIDGLHRFSMISGYRLIIRTIQGQIFRSASGSKRGHLDDIVEIICSNNQ